MVVFLWSVRKTSVRVRVFPFLAIFEFIFFNLLQLVKLGELNAHSHLQAETMEVQSAPFKLKTALIWIKILSNHCHCHNQPAVQHLDLAPAREGAVQSLQPSWSYAVWRRGSELCAKPAPCGPAGDYSGWNKQPSVREEKNKWEH